MAVWFKELPGMQTKLQMLQQAKVLGMEFHGIDLLQAQLEPIYGEEARYNQRLRHEGIDRLNEARNTELHRQLMHYHAAEKGIVFVMGQLHYEGLVRAFAADNYLSNVVFLHPHSVKLWVRTVEDRVLPAYERHQQLTVIDQAITQEADQALFVTKLISTLYVLAVKTQQFPMALQMLTQPEQRRVINVNHSDSKQMTALHYACAYGALDLVINLVAEGADIHAKNSLGRTPIDYCSGEDKALAALFSANGFEPVEKDRALLESCLANHTATRNWLMTQGATFDWLIRYYASNNNTTELSALLTYSTASSFMNIAGQPSGRTALHNVAAKGHIEACALLLQAGANPNLGDKDKNTALHLAVFQKQVDMVVILKTRGARSDIKNKAGQTVDDLLALETYSAIQEKIEEQRVLGSLVVNQSGF